MERTDLKKNKSPVRSTVFGCIKGGQPGSSGFVQLTSSTRGGERPRVSRLPSVLRSSSRLRPLPPRLRTTPDGSSPPVPTVGDSRRSASGSRATRRTRNGNGIVTMLAEDGPAKLESEMATKPVGRFQMRGEIANPLGYAYESSKDDGGRLITFVWGAHAGARLDRDRPGRCRRRAPGLPGRRLRHGVGQPGSERRPDPARGPAHLSSLSNAARVSGVERSGT